MGGTEIGLALRHACPKKAGKRSNANVLLITDGEIYESEKIIESNRHRGHRIFTLGVGSAVSASFLQRLAGATGGACELVAPNEQMAEHIVRHFGRMRQLRVTHAEVRWGNEALWSVPEGVSGVFAGDTLHVGAGFYSQPEGDATLWITYEDGSTQTLETSIAMVDVESATAAALPRVLAHQRLPQLTDSARVTTAIDYQLLTKGTKCLMTHQRAEGEKAEDLPALRNVPQHMAAGHGGFGSVIDSALYARPMAKRRQASYSASVDTSSSMPDSLNEDYSFDIPAFLRRQVDKDDGDGSKTTKNKPKQSLSSLFSRRRKASDEQENAGTPIKTLAVARDIRWKLAGRQVHTVEALIAIPSADWDAYFGLNDAEIAELLRALRKAGFRAS